MQITFSPAAELHPIVRGLTQALGRWLGKGPHLRVSPPLQSVALWFLEDYCSLSLS